MKILVLGATGLLGNTVFRVLSESGNHWVIGTARDELLVKSFIPQLAENIRLVSNLEDISQLEDVFDAVRPHVVINCISLSKEYHLNLEKTLSTFALFPRRLMQMSRAYKARLIHMSTDGVFSGDRGNYTEDDITDAKDLYGITKFLGEVECLNAITIRASIIGHSLSRKTGLVDWFLAQHSTCNGYVDALFSGLPTVSLSRIVRDIILLHPQLQGIYHIAAHPISKFDLLNLIAKRYGKEILVVPDRGESINRVLSADKFSQVAGYVPASWPQLIDEMHDYSFGLGNKNV